MVNQDARPSDDLFDSLIVGGGPAGLMAATYLARFRRRVIVVDAGQSRARWIPLTRNCPGFPDGISGVALLERLRQQALRFGAELAEDTVNDLRLEGPTFIAHASLPIRARSVLIATGIVDTLPEGWGIAAMIAAGTLRLCPICDGYEVIEKRVAVIGPADAAIKKALFMRTYSSNVTVLATGEPREVDASELSASGIEIEACAPASVRPAGNQVDVILADGRSFAFDTLYPAMGCTIRSGLAVALGAECDALGNLLTDAHQRTAIPGLYAAGDVVNEINQIAVAFGHAAIAASDMHNYLAKGCEER